jgi:hypothetical protein
MVWWRVAAMGVLTLAASAPVAADEGEEAAHAAAAPAARAGPLRVAPAVASPWTMRPVRAGAAWGIGVVEMPATTPLPGPRRPHHALSIASESPRHLLRSIGIEATDCSTRFRLPTKLRPFGGGVQADVQGQLLVACRF